MQSFFVRDSVHVARQLERIDAMKQLEQRQGMTDFVPL